MSIFRRAIKGPPKTCSRHERWKSAWHNVQYRRFDPSHIRQVWVEESEGVREEKSHA